jgi:hypothetical protein
VPASTWPIYTARSVGQAPATPSSTLPARVSSQGGAVTGTSGPWSAGLIGGQPEHWPQRAGQFPGEREQRQREGQPRGAEQGGQYGAGDQGSLGVHAEQPSQRRVVGVAPGGGGALGSRRQRPGQQHRRRDPAVRVPGEGRPGQRGG